MPDIFVSPSAAPLPQDVPARGRNRWTNHLSHALSAYLLRPEGIRFETQEQDEQIILFLRRHWITNFSWVSISLILIVTPILLFPLIIQSGFISSENPLAIVTFFILLWYLLTSSYMLVNFILWYFNISIVSNERIIDIDFVNILNKKFAATRIAKVEDVTLRTGGFIRTIFDYGDVIVQTAGTNVQFEFLAVPHPEQVVRIINNLMEQLEGGP